MNSAAEVAKFFGPNLLYFFAGLLVPAGIGTGLAWGVAQLWPAAWENREVFAFAVFFAMSRVSLRYTKCFGHPTHGDTANCLIGLCLGVALLMSH